MTEEQIVAELATKVMKWGDEGKYWAKSSVVVISKSIWNPLHNIEDAWMIANKLGLCVIPQSAENGFRWFACDIERVSYRGEEISIKVKDDSGYSKETAQEAICYSALEVVKTL